jgi:hypothetical protein
LDRGLISRVRRNHGLEHATLHVLTEGFPGRPLAGHSDVGGFWIIGELETPDVISAAEEALARLQAGERRLAVHPSCGTNFATAGVLAGLAAGAAMFGAGRKLRTNIERLPAAIMLATLALVVAQPLGLLVQERFTTSGEPGSLQVVEVKRVQNSRLPVHRVATQG